MRMEEKLRSSDQNEILVKKRSSSGCLIVRKKGDAVAATSSAGYRKAYDAKNEKKRPRLVMTDSESSEDLLLPPPRRAVPMKHASHGSELPGLNGSEIRKRNMSNVCSQDEYGAALEVPMSSRKFGDGGKFSDSPSFRRSSSRTAPGNRKNLYHDGMSSSGQADFDNVDWYDMRRSENEALLVLPQERSMKNIVEPIRVQGKNGVLKVHINKMKVGDYGQWKREERRNFSWSEDMVNRNTAAVSSYAGIRRSEKPSSLLRVNKSQKNLHNSMATMKSNSSDQDSEDSHALLRHSLKNHKPARREGVTEKNVAVLPSKEENKRFEKLKRKVGNKLNSQKLVSAKISDGCFADFQDNRSYMKQISKNAEVRDFVRTGSEDNENPPKSKGLAPVKSIKRGSGTEKQKLRENIKNMLLNAGWTIDYRPRRNRDYLDAVYINPAGTGYWSIVKAYEALQKQLDVGNDEEKACGNKSTFKLPDETLSQLTRKTQKKIEKEMKRKQKEEIAAIASRKALYCEDGADSMGCDSQEESLSPSLKQEVKSSLVNADDNLCMGLNKNLVNYSEISLNRRKSTKPGRCTLLVRRSDNELNSDSDGFVAYNGKRSLLSWLIDSGVVQLSQKVHYMNQHGTKVLLEGRITRDGIHCGCCSKILTVSKFEIHAGSKLHQPFQNTYLDSGVSLLQCQIDAWNRKEEFKQLGFFSVKTDGDDPNDDTCGICGDGGDLICCDACPSTFHQSCLSIEVIPMSNWHCPACTCKFCGLASACASHDSAASISGCLTCNLCQTKFHKSCKKDFTSCSADSTVSNCFCSQKCRELFEHLQDDLGVKHELEGGFSWCFIRRTDLNSDPSSPRFPHRVECNCKLAVAYSVMDECFLPILDRRSGINVMHNVLYNCGSNFNRINFSGFYTVILERGDEIISAASLRFNGAHLAEMPFIGTRDIYRRRGMCRRLFSAIESALRSFNVERLFIPAIPELMKTWTGAFGFSSLADSFKYELRSLNMMVFPGLEMLQKFLLEKGTTASEKTAVADLDGDLVEVEKIEKVNAVASPVSERAEFDVSSLQLSNAVVGDVKEVADGTESDGNSSSSDGSSVSNTCSDDTADNNEPAGSNEGGQIDAETEEEFSDTESEETQTPIADGGSVESTLPIQFSRKDTINSNEMNRCSPLVGQSAGGGDVDMTCETDVQAHFEEETEDCQTQYTEAGAECIDNKEVKEGVIVGAKNDWKPREDSCDEMCPEDGKRPDVEVENYESPVSDFKCGREEGEGR